MTASLRSILKGSITVRAILLVILVSLAIGVLMPSRGDAEPAAVLFETFYWDAQHLYKAGERETNCDGVVTYFWGSVTGHVVSIDNRHYCLQ